MRKRRYDPTADEGVHTVARIFNRDFGWIFRPQPTADVGIDAHVEICKDGEPLGKLLALQIKSGESYFREQSDKGYVYRGSLTHREYWLDHPLPVVLVLYNPKSEQVYWQAVLEEHVKTTGKGWRIVVPYNQRLNKTARPNLLCLTEGEAGDRYVDEDLIDIVEQEVESLSTGLWPPAVKVVGTEEIEALRDTFTGRKKELVESLTEALWRKNITLAEWELATAHITKSTFLCLYALAKGGWNSITERDLKRVGEMLRQHYRSLHAFALDIAKGRYNIQNDIDEIIERSKLYIDYGLLAFEMGKAVRGDFDLVYIKSDEGWTVKLQKNQTCGKSKP